MTNLLRILFVEEREDEVLSILHELKRAWGKIDWKRVESQEEMQAMLTSFAWDVVIADHAMLRFGPDGGALVDVQALNLDIPFIVVSSVASEDIVTAAMRNGAHDVVSKNNLVRLVPAIQRAIKESSLRQEGHKLQAQIENRERRHSNLFTDNPAPILLVDAGTLLIEDANPAAASFFGFSLQSLRQAGLRAIVGQQALSICRRFKDQTAQRSCRFTDQARISDGSIREVEIFACAIPQGRRILFCATIFDETKRHEVAAGRARLTEAVEQMSDAIAIIDAKGVISYANPAFEKLTGHTITDLEGLSLERLGLDVLCERIAEQSHTGHPWEGHLRLRTLGGTFVETSVTLSPVKDIEDDALRMVVSLRDITRDVETEKHLRQVEKMAALGAFAEYATKQLLPFSRCGGERGIPVDLSAVMRASLRLVRSTLPENIKQYHDINPGLWVKADPFLLNQVIINLAFNAFHAMEDTGGLLAVSLGEVCISREASNVPVGLEEGRYAQLTIRDTGHGMDPRTLERSGQGAGLGLSMVQAIVSQLGGIIQVPSELGFGTTIQLFIPCAPGERVTKNDELSEDVSGSERILFVDDEEILTTLAKRGLQQWGYRVTTRTSAREALELFQNSPKSFDLLFTDLVMPDMNGAELANRMRAIRPDLPVLMVSGLSAASALAMTGPAAFKGIVTKPFSPFDLAKSARSVLAETRPLAGGESVASAPFCDDTNHAKGHAILLAEDSNVTRSLIRVWLECAGYQVIEAKDGQEAWEIFQRKDPSLPISLLLTDVEMPRLDGIELAKRLRKEDPSIPIAILTTNKEPILIKQALQLGANEFLNKPFEPRELIDCVERLLAERSTRVEARRSAETAQAVRLAQQAMVAVPEKDLSLFSLHEPLTDAGGDVFHGFRCLDNSVFFVLADVAGHSVVSSYAVAAFLAMLSTHVRECHALRPAANLRHDAGGQGESEFSCGVFGKSPCEPLRHLALKLNRDIQEGPFSEVPICTLLGLWTPETGRLQLLNAGIPHGLLCRKDEGKTYPISLNGTPLGILSKPIMDERVLYLQPGDRMLLGTDGFFDVLAPSKTVFEDIAPEHWNGLKESPIQVALTRICEMARNHGNGVIADDLLVIGFEQPVLALQQGELHLRIPTHPRFIDLAHKQFSDFIGDTSKGLGLSSERRFDLGLALREALANAVFHGNQEREEALVDLYCHIDMQAEKLVVSVADEGQGFELGSPTTVVEPHAERGRGIPLIRHFAQNLRVVGSELTMEFNLQENRDGQKSESHAKQEVR